MNFENYPKGPRGFNIRRTALIMGAVGAIVSLPEGIASAVVTGGVFAALVGVFGLLRRRLVSGDGPAAAGDWGTKRFELIWFVIAVAAAVSFGAFLIVERGLLRALIVLSPVVLVFGLWGALRWFYGRRRGTSA